MKTVYPPQTKFVGGIKQLATNQDKRFVGSDLGPIHCSGYQQMSKAVASGKRVKVVERNGTLLLPVLSP